MAQLDEDYLGFQYFKDNQQRARWAIWCFWGIVILNTVAVLSQYMEYDLLQRIANGSYGDYTQEEAEANDIRQMVVGLASFVVHLASIITFLMWFRRAYANLHRAKFHAINYNDSLAVWSFFIPFLSLYWPFNIAREIVDRTREKIRELAPDKPIATSKVLVGFWWALFILTNVVSNFTLRGAFDTDDLDGMIDNAMATMISDFLEIPAAFITLVMIRQMAQDEATLIPLRERELEEQELRKQEAKQGKTSFLIDTEDEEGESA